MARLRTLVLTLLLLLTLAPALALASGGEEKGHDDHHGTNWAQGLLGESDEGPYGVLWRPKGTPPPYLALVLNAGLLYFLFWKFGAGPLGAALKKRKADIMEGIESAGEMKRDARERLDGYEKKLERIDSEIKRIRKEMRAAAEIERERALTEARERRTRMEREAKLLIEQELEAAREELHIETVRAAVSGAEGMITSKLTPQDQQRLADEYLSGLEQTLINSRGGRA